MNSPFQRICLCLETRMCEPCRWHISSTICSRVSRAQAESSSDNWGWSTWPVCSTEPLHTNRPWKRFALSFHIHFSIFCCFGWVHWLLSLKVRKKKIIPWYFSENLHVFKEAVYSSFHFVWKKTNRVRELQFFMLKYVCPNYFGTGNNLKSYRTFGLCRMELSCPSCVSAFSRGKGWTVCMDTLLCSLWDPITEITAVHRRELWSQPWARQGQLSCSLSWYLPET